MITLKCKCKQSFTIMPNYMINKENITCPNCENVASQELLEVLVAISKRSLETKKDIGNAWTLTIDLPVT